MKKEQLIRVDNICVLHNVEFSFINTLYEFGLIEITTQEDIAFIPESDLQQAERFIRLHNELQIIPEGVEAVSYLLEKIKLQEEKIMRLENRLRFYEG